MKKVFLYALSTCPWCRKAKQFFKENNIPFEYVYFDLADDGTQEKIREEMTRKIGRVTFPHVIIGEEIVVGWNPEKYRRLLEV